MTATVVQITAPRKHQPSPADARRPFARDACAWSEAIEQVTLTNLRIVFAWQRVLLRAWWGA